MAGQTHEEITAVYLGENFRFAGADGTGDTIVGRAMQYLDNGEKEQIIIKGREPSDYQLLRNKQYRFFGRWREYTNKRTGEKQQQFNFNSYVETEPAGRDAVVSYLLDAARHARAKLGRDCKMNFGPARAGKLWDAFGEDAIRVCREDIDAAMKVAGIKLRFIAEALAEELDRRKGIERCTMDLLDLLNGRGIPKKIIPLALKHWKNRAADFIRRNPYLLMKFSGVGFPTADKMYLGLGHNPQRLKRVAYRIWHAIASRGSGDTWVDAQRVVHALANVGHNEDDIRRGMLLAKRGKLIDVERTDSHGCICDSGGDVWLSVRGESRNEADVARIVADRMSEPAHWPQVMHDSLTDHQTDAIMSALSGPVSMLVGSPGCGKTFSAARIIEAIIHLHGKDSVAVAAPTGKAAVRVTESLNGAGITLRASTIHSLLKVESVGDGGGGWSFKHGPRDPLPHHFIVVDESSMIDVDLMAALLRATRRGTHLLFIGDTNQLAPVGHGAPLRDFIRAGLPCGELREILRNDGGIVQACADIRDGKKFRCDGNLEYVECGADAMFGKCVELAERVQSMGFDPVWDYQVIVPINEKSPVSRKKLNEFLQRKFNSHNVTEKCPFWPGDKVVNTSNTRLPQLDLKTRKRTGAEVYVANGELGKVIEADRSHFIVRLWAPDRLVFVPRGQDGVGCSWDLGYALSCHRCQGSEWPFVAVVLDGSSAAKRVCDRSWLYTGISRAKTHCWLIGNLHVAHSMCRRQQLDKRKTLLVERINRCVTQTLVDAI